jgi:hypothetical protein
LEAFGDDDQGVELRRRQLLDGFDPHGDSRGSGPRRLDGGIVLDGPRR